MLKISISPLNFPKKFAFLDENFPTKNFRQFSDSPKFREAAIVPCLSLGRDVTRPSDNNVPLLNFNFQRLNVTTVVDFYPIINR